MRLDSSTDDRATTQSLTAPQTTGYFLQCWDEVWQKLASDSYFKVTDEFLLDVLTTKAAVYDLWSFLNGRAQLLEH